MAHWCHSTLDLLANSVSSQTCKPSQWRVISGRQNKRVGYRNFLTVRQWWSFFPPKILPMHFIVSNALSVNKICILFQKTKMIKLKPNPNDPVSGRSVSISDWPEIAYFAKLISNIFQSSTGDMRSQTWNLEWTSMPSLSAYNIRMYSKVEDCETENKARVNTEYEWEKMAAATTLTSSRHQILW